MNFAQLSTFSASVNTVQTRRTSLVFFFNFFPFPFFSFFPFLLLSRCSRKIPSFHVFVPLSLFLSLYPPFELFLSKSLEA